jgi:hypothetical protein
MQCRSTASVYAPDSCIALDTEECLHKHSYLVRRKFIHYILDRGNVTIDIRLPAKCIKLGHDCYLPHFIQFITRHYATTRRYIG